MPPTTRFTFLKVLLSFLYLVIVSLKVMCCISKGFIRNYDRFGPLKSGALLKTMEFYFLWNTFVELLIQIAGIRKMYLLAPASGKWHSKGYVQLQSGKRRETHHSYFEIFKELVQSEILRHFSKQEFFLWDLSSTKRLKLWRRTFKADFSPWILLLYIFS